MEKAGRFLLPLLGVLTIIAALRMFIQDDAFITFRYSEHLAQGHGLVFNIGERVEGYTNFLWAVWLSIPFFLGMDVVPFSLWSGIALFPMTLLGTYNLARFLALPERAALGVVALVGLNASFSAYATGGLETQLQACCTVWGAYLALSAAKAPSWARVIGLGLVLAAACLTRMDGFLISALSALYLAWAARKGLLPIKMVTAGAMVFLAVVGAWLCWKVAYYGDILPNTFYVKAPTLRARLGGIAYAGIFLAGYGLLFFIPTLLVNSVKRRWQEPAAANFLVCFAALWTLYVIYVGGDFMEFRFMIPATPILYVLVATAIQESARSNGLKHAMIGILALLGLAQPLWFRSGYGVNTIAILEAPVDGPDSEWVQAGQILNKTFAGVPIKTAIMPAGAVPFYSKLYTLDMLGLNEKWVARNGEHYLDKPGHHRIAPFKYLQEQKVDLVLGHPFIVTEVPRAEYDHTIIDLLLMRKSPADFRAGAAIGYGPVSQSRFVPVLILRPEPATLDLMRSKGWIVRPLQP